MTPCARGCCWSPFSCSKQRTCPCHWADHAAKELRGSDSSPVRRPTEDQAIRNVMAEQRGRKK